MKLIVMGLTRESEKTFIFSFILLYRPVFEHFVDLKNLFMKMIGWLTFNRILTLVGYLIIFFI